MYHQRLIEVAFPIGRVSDEACRDRNVFKGHPQDFHKWWAVRPLPLNRAAILAALLPDPDCDNEFQSQVAKIFNIKPSEARRALVEFIAQFSAKENAAKTEFLEKSRLLLEAAYPDKNPVVLDPFAGLGTIPFEALRVGAHSVAGDLNPVAYLIERALLDYLPRFGERLVAAIERWGHRLLDELEKQAGYLYPSEPDGLVVWWYVLARVVVCEACGTRIPLLRNLRLDRNRVLKVSLRYWGNPTANKVEYEIFHPTDNEERQPPIGCGFKVTCPVCGFHMRYSTVRGQIRAKSGGAKDAELIAKAVIEPGGKLEFRLPNPRDLELITRAALELEDLKKIRVGPLTLLPQEAVPKRGIQGFNPSLWGFDVWTDFYTPRQLLILGYLVGLFGDIIPSVKQQVGDPLLSEAVLTCLALVISRFLTYYTSLSIVINNPRSLFDLGVAVAMRAMFCEVNPFAGRLLGSFTYVLDRMLKALESSGRILRHPASVYQGSATNIPLADNSVTCIVTDPPYFDSIPYSHLSDFNYVWLKRMLFDIHPGIFTGVLSPKDEECIAGFPGDDNETFKTDKDFKELMTKALKECRRVIRPDGVMVIYYAHKGFDGWIPFLEALLNAGWMVTAAWPVKAERPTRIIFRYGAFLNSVLLIVCRPVGKRDVANWDDVKNKLRFQLADWMLQMRNEGIVGTDLFHSFIGPSAKVYSRYEIKNSAGGIMPLGDYLRQVSGLIAEVAYANLPDVEKDAKLLARWLIESRQQQKTRLPYSLALDIMRAAGINSEDEIARVVGPGGVLNVRGNYAELSSLSQRQPFLATKNEHRKTTLDRLHSVLLVIEERDWRKVKELIRGPLRTDSRLWQLAEALCLLYPEGRRERSLTEMLLSLAQLYT